MERLERCNAREERGFTLVELLVVVVILAVLSAVAVPVFLGQREKAEDAAAQSNIATISQVISNGFSVGATPSVSGGAVAYTSAVGTQEVVLGGATASIVDSSDWCVEQEGGSETFHMTPLASVPASGECASPAGPPGVLDVAWQPVSNLSDSVRVVAQDGDGWIVGGNFTDVEGLPSRDRLIRINEDGALDSSWNAPANMNGAVYTIAQDGAGWIVGGNFTNVGGNPASDYLVRLSADGSLDTGWNPPAIGNLVYTVIPDGSGGWMVGGNFVMVNGNPQMNGVIQLNSDASLNTSFVTPDLMWTGLPSHLTIVPDGAGWIIAGSFQDAGFDQGVGGAFDRIVRVSNTGQVDTAFVPPPLNTGTVYSVVSDGSGGFIVGGTFTNVGGNPNRDYLIRLNSNGSLDTGWNAPTFTGGGVLTIAPDGGGWVIGGTLLTIGGDSGRNYLARVNGDGTLDSGWSTPALSERVYSIAPDTNGWIIGGMFTDVDGDSSWDRLLRVYS